MFYNRIEQKEGVLAVKQQNTIPWETIYEVVLECGDVHDQMPFATEVLKQIPKLCSYDEGLIYFLNGNGDVTQQYLVRIGEHWSNTYLQYYSKDKAIPYTIHRPWRESSRTPIVIIRNWLEEPMNDFIRDYIRPREIAATMGFVLSDINGLPRTVFALDRKGRGYTHEEIQNMKLVVSLLNNLHKNFFCELDRNLISQIPWETTALTKREIEVANLLCQGVSPANISKTLHITYSTANKHIANIYKKLQVSSRQELLVRLLR